VGLRKESEVNLQDVIDFRQARRDLFARQDRALGEGLEKAHKLYAERIKQGSKWDDKTRAKNYFRLQQALEGLIVPCQQLYGEGGWYLIQDLAETWGLDL
jgi:Zn-dependent oligopeptidase